MWCFGHGSNSGLLDLSPSSDEVSRGDVSPTPAKESGTSWCPTRPFLDPRPSPTPDVLVHSEAGPSNLMKQRELPEQQTCSAWWPGGLPPVPIHGKYGGVLCDEILTFDGDSDHVCTRSTTNSFGGLNASNPPSGMSHCVGIIQGWTSWGRREMWVGVRNGLVNQSSRSHPSKLNDGVARSEKGAIGDPTTTLTATSTPRWPHT